jgi:hypothetical protein
MANPLLPAFLVASLLGQPARLPAAGSAKVQLRQVTPSDTDRRIDRLSGDGWEHWVYFCPAATKKQQLVVFLAGTGGKGNGAKAFCTLAARLGFLVVSLAYPSTISISVVRDSADRDAFLKARENVVYGKVPFPPLRVNEPNSIHNRLQKLLRWLAAEHPKERWGQYLDRNGGLQWGKLVLAGQSQGGGHAGLLAMQHEVARVLMFGSPKDFSTYFKQPAKWYSGPNATPLDRFFSFGHRGDEGHGCTYEQQLQNYRAMKLLPRYKVVDVDKRPAPYGHSRLLTSSRPEESPHGAPIGNKAHATVWKYMLQEATR